MKSIAESLKEFNATWNDIPRRLLLILIMFGSLFLLLLALPYVAPFALAAVFAWIIERIARLFLGWLGDSRALRGVISAVLVLVVIGIVFYTTLYLSNVIIGEVKSLAVVLPGFVGNITQEALAWIDGFNWDDAGFLEIGINIEDTLVRLLGEVSSMVTTLASRVASGAAGMVLRAVSLLPQGILFIVMTVFGTFYMSADRERIFSFYRRLLPERFHARSTMVRSGFLTAIFSQFRAAFFIFLATFAVLVVGFIIIRVDYAILFALLVALIDMLPVLGAGLFLLPMAAYGFASGNLLLCVGSAVLYIIIIIIRQFLQPMIVGEQIGMHPLLTMIAMYAGFIAQGVLGMMLAPIMLTLCKIVLSDGREAEPEAKEVPPKRKPRKRGKKRKR